MKKGYDNFRDSAIQGVIKKDQSKRHSPDLEDVGYKVYSRDIFGTS